MTYKFYHALFTFNGNAMFVEYGEGLPSHSIWLVPGTWEDFD